MVKFLLCLTIIYLSSSIISGAQEMSICDNGWIPYEDEKCVRLFEIFSAREQAEGICRDNGATLVSITSAAEQQLLTQLILSSSNAVNVWIGAQRRLDNSSEFVWDDGTDVRRFTYWAIGHPTKTVGRNCVQMRSQLSRQVADMEWVDIACSLPNWFICQKLQLWQPENIQQAILGLRRELRDSVHSFTSQIDDMTHQLDMTKKELNHLQENPIPIGFIYTQLPGQPEPEKLWPAVKWDEISQEYAGIFFRVVGGNSAPFEVIQAENSPRLTNVRGRIVLTTAVSPIVVEANGAASPTLSVGATGATSHWGLSFTVSGGEVRPRNTAIRIWIRI